MYWTLIITGLGLGLAYTATPGAVNTEAIRRGILRGGRATLLVETGSLIGDSVWAILALTGVTFLAQHLAFRVILGIIGGFFLLRLAWGALHEVLFRPKQASISPTSARGDFATGVVFGLANPMGLAFWSGLGGSIVTAGATGQAFAFFFIGFFVGATLWCFAIAALLQWGKRWVRPTFFRWINLLCGLALGYFGLRSLWTVVQEWL
jgi:threonine/homoserine/homoserine lactone efflux protein